MTDGEHERERAEIHMLTQARQTLRRALGDYFKQQQMLIDLAQIERRLAALEAGPGGHVAPDALAPTATAKKEKSK